MPQPVTVTVRQVIAAPPELVFAVVTDPTLNAQLSDDVLSIDIHERSPEGFAVRFSERRRLGRGEATFVYERVDTDLQGLSTRVLNTFDATDWDTRFVVQPHPEGAELSLHMEATGHRWGKRVQHVLLQWLYAWGMRKQLRSWAAYCAESASSQSRSNDAHPS